MNTLKELVVGLALLTPGIPGGLASAQSIPGIPEPGLVMYGTVVNTNSSRSGALGAGVVNWSITGNDSTSAVSTTIVDVNGKYFYIAKVPFETRHIGTDSF